MLVLLFAGPLATRRVKTTHIPVGLLLVSHEALASLRGRVFGLNAERCKTPAKTRASAAFTVKRRSGCWAALPGGARGGSPTPPPNRPRGACGSHRARVEEHVERLLEKNSEKVASGTQK